MNPVLLKPGSDRRSHVVLMGRPAGEVSPDDWEGAAAPRRGRICGLRRPGRAVRRGRRRGRGQPGRDQPARRRLRQHGAGPARRPPRVVVGDIDRGGVFAAMYGTVALLEPADQALVAGLRRQQVPRRPRAARPRADELERLTGRPVYGVLPWHPACGSTPRTRSTSTAGAPRPPPRTAGRGRPAARISNFTDVDALGLEPDLDVVFASRPATSPTPTWSSCPAPGPPSPTWPGCARADSTARWSSTRGAVGRCSASAAASRCSATDRRPRRCRGPSRAHRPRARTARRDGPTFAAEDAGLPRASHSASRRRATRSTTAGSRRRRRGVPRRRPRGRVFGTMWHGSLEGDALRGGVPRRVARRCASGVSASPTPARPARPARRPGRGASRRGRAARARRGGAPAGLPVLPPGGSA